MRLFKGIGIFATLISVTIFSTITFAFPFFGHNQQRQQQFEALENAKKIAAQYVPAESKCVKTEIDDYKYELKFYNKDNTESYEIELNISDNTLVKFESELVFQSGSTNVVKTEEDIKSIVLTELPQANIISVYINIYDYLKEYKVNFTNGLYKGEYEINPETGVILERKFEYNPVAAIPPVEGVPVTPNTSTTQITIEQAKEIALKQLPDALITEIKADYDDGRLIYEGKMFKGGLKYEFEIDALSGQIIDWDIDD